MIRPPAVAGRFYPDDPSRLTEKVDSFLAADIPDQITIQARACLVPHAGYLYSGSVAGAVYRRMEIPPRIVIIGPRHFPRGAGLAILTEGEWQTPLGLVPIDRGLGSRIAHACPLLREDGVAHRTEHSIEVQLPFLQRVEPGFTFVPIVIGPPRYSELQELGHALATVIAEEAAPVLIVASSDMNHYESDEITRVKDRKAIDRILALDPAGLFDIVREEDISMCGYAAAVTALIASVELGADHSELVDYATSGDVNGERQEVVGYAGMIVS